MLFVWGVTFAGISVDEVYPPLWVQREGIPLGTRAEHEGNPLGTGVEHEGSPWHQVIIFNCVSL